MTPANGRPMVKNVSHGRMNEIMRRICFLSQSPCLREAPLGLMPMIFKATVRAALFRWFSAGLARFNFNGSGCRETLSTTRPHDLDSPIFRDEQPVQSKPINHPSTDLVSVPTVLWKIGKRNAVANMLLAHALKQLAKTRAEVEPNGRGRAFCLNVPGVAGDRMRA